MIVKYTRLQDNNFLAERAALIVNIIEHESISVEQILELSPHSSRYLVPFNQSKSKHHGLIFFNTEDRQGAENEASYMKQALQLTGCEIIQQEWSAAHQLGDMIDNALTDILAECSLLVVCIMTHGYRGTLSGGEGTEISVNDVLNQLTTSLPGHLPLVSKTSWSNCCSTASAAIVMKIPRTSLLPLLADVI